MTDSILPASVSDLERDLELAIARIEQVDIPIATLWNPDLCPLDVLPFLAWSLSVDVWVSDWPEATKRNVIKSSLPQHRIKGTRLAVENGLKSLSLDTELQEWFETKPQGVPGTFNVDVYVSEQGITVGLIDSARRTIDNVKRCSAHYSLTMNFSVSGRKYAAGTLQIMGEISGHPFEPVLDDISNQTYRACTVQILAELEGIPFNDN